MTDRLRLFATTAKGMESLLAQELRSFGAADVEEKRAGVSFSGPLETAYRACLWSRIANRVLLPLKTFPAPNPEKLYGGVKSIRWSEHMTVKQTLAVDFSSSHSAITHTQFGALKVKDAVVDQFRSNEGERPSVDTIRPDIRINVYVHEDVATVSLDLSGESLHLRGYREQGVAAPLKENLAAAILALADWEKIAARGGSFIDPMCGSGTLPIEAALIATRTAPGLMRQFYGFLGWQGHVPAMWNRLLDQAKNARITDPKKIPRIVGYDRDFRAIRVALSNVERAGLRGVVHIEKRDFEALEPVETHATESPRGIVVLNPPYGERIGDMTELKALHSKVGDIFKQRFKGWDGFVFTGSSELAKEIGLKASRRHVLFNGAIECRLLKYEMFEGSRTVSKV